MEIAPESAAWFLFVLRLGLADPQATRSLLRREMTDAELAAVDAELDHRLKTNPEARGD